MFGSKSAVLFLSLTVAPVVSAQCGPCIVHAGGFAHDGPSGGGPWLAGQVHVIQSLVQVPQGQTLTLHPGTIVKAGLSSSLIVFGTLLVQGTATNPVHFTTLSDDSIGGDHNGNGNATLPYPGEWFGITLGASSTGCVLRHCEVRWTGNSGAIDAGGSTLPLFENIVVRDAAGAGLRFGASPPLAVTNCAFERCQRPITGVSPVAVPFFTGNTSTNCTEGDSLFVNGQLPSTTLTNDPTWGLTHGMSTGSFVIEVNFTVAVGTTWTLEAGCTLRMGSAKTITVAGGMVANGTVGNPVLLTGVNSQPGAWGGVASGPAATFQLTSTSIRYGSTANLRLGTGPSTLTGCRFENASGHGLDINTGLSTVASCQFNGNGGRPVKQIGLSQLGGFSNCTASGNAQGDAVVLGAGTLTGAATLSAANAFNGTGTFILGETATVGSGATLTVAADVVLKADPATSPALVVHGTLLCNGTPAMPVVFTSLNDDYHGNINGNTTNTLPGDWSGLRFSTLSDASTLTYTEVRYAGLSGSAAVDLGDADITMTDCAVSDSAGPGLDAGGSAPLLTNCAFDRNTLPVTGLDIVTVGSLVGCTAQGNSAGDALRMGPTTVTGSVTVVKANSLNGTGVLVMEGDLTVGSSGMLALNPDVVLKFWNTRVLANGTLNANGAFFTSWQDDTAGGDSLGDGPTVGSPGEWTGISLTGATGSLLINSSVRYAGKNGTAAVVTNLSNATLDGVTISNSAGPGIEPSGGSLPTVTGCAFNACTVPIQNANWRALPNFSANTAQGSTIGDYIRVLGNPTGSGPLTIGANNLLNGGTNQTGDLVVANTPSFGVPLTIGPGVVIRIEPGAYLQFSAPVTSNGTESHPVVFTSPSDGTFGFWSAPGSPTPGSWRQLQFQPSASGSTLTWTKVRYAGQNNDPAINISQPGNVALCFVTVEYCQGSAVDLNFGAQAVIKGSTFENNGGTAIERLTWAALANMTGNSASGNSGAGDATRIDSPSVVGELVIEKDNYFGNCVVVSVSPSISGSNSLSFGRGVVIKAENPQVTMKVKNILGTGREKTVFTSIHDDQYGGDTNGAPTAPAPGDWIGLEANGDLVDHALVRYAGGGTSQNPAGLFGPVHETAASRVEFSAAQGFRLTGIGAVGKNLVAFQNQGDGIYCVSTVTSSTAVANGGSGIVALYTSYCIAWNNSGPTSETQNYAAAAIPVGNTAHVVFSCGTTLGFGTPGPFYCPWTGFGNLHADPLFLDEANGDLELTAGSPCVDFVIPPISQATLCDPNVCTPWSVAACSLNLAPFPEPKPGVRDFSDYPRPLSSTGTLGNVRPDLGAYERSSYHLLLLGETQLGTTPNLSVVGPAGTAMLLAGFDAPGLRIPNLGAFLLDPQTWFLLGSVPVGTVIPLPLTLDPALHDFRISAQALILSPTGAPTTLTNVLRARIHY